MKQKVYIESSVIGYLTARLSRDLIVASHQQLTQEWWANQRNKFDLFILTWNCKHIANAAMRSQIEQIGRTRGYEPVIICTPEELLED